MNRMRTAVRNAVQILVALGAVFAAGADQPKSATVSFTIDFPNANPSHYEIVLARDGHGSYSSTGQLSADATPADPTPYEFTLSDKVRDTIFDLAQRAHYFTGNVDSGNKKIANTGAKTLAYKDAEHTGRATYNYSLNPVIQQLTEIFQNLSTTLEYGRRLTYFHKYQKTALDDDLARMEEMQRSNELGDVQAIAPILHEIANDQSVMRIARAKAIRLLAAGEKQ
jgi:hypothetical protein